MRLEPDRAIQFTGEHPKMNNVVRRWRRILAFAMLGLIISMSGFWTRSFFVRDELDYQVGKNASLYVSSTPGGIVLDSVKQFITDDDSVRWTSEKRTYPYMYLIPPLAMLTIWLLRTKRETVTNFIVEVTPVAGT